MTIAAQTPHRYQPSRSPLAKIKRRMTQWRAVKPMLETPENTIITFTFDDFPRSAARYGAEILERYDARGAYYACTGYMGGKGPGGDYYTAEDLIGLSRRGHEIAAHSHRHINCAENRPQDALSDIETNLDAFSTVGLSRPPAHFAYPYGETCHNLKTRLAERFDTCRGVLPGINRAGSDLTQLRAVELGDSDSAMTRAERAIETAARSPGWLVFFTHDVQPTPTRFGISPAKLDRLVKRAKDSGAIIATPSQAMAQIHRAPS